MMNAGKQAVSAVQWAGQQRRRAMVVAHSWYNRPRFWVCALAFFLAGGAAAVVYRAGLSRGYEWLWLNTTGKQYTYLMRDNPLLLAVPAAVLVAGIVVTIGAVSPGGFLEGIVRPAEARRPSALRWMWRCITAFFVTGPDAETVSDRVPLGIVRQRLLTRVIVLVVLLTALGFIFGHVWWGGNLRESKAFHDGEEVIVWVTAVSSGSGAGAELRSWLGSQVASVPGLAPDGAAGAPALYVFTNGKRGRGSLGRQHDVLEAAPGTGGSTQVYRVHTVRWRAARSARQLTSAEEVRGAWDRGELEVVQTDVAASAPARRWGSWGS